MAAIPTCRSWASLLHTVRAPAAIIAATGAVLALPPQTRDLIAGLWESGRLWHVHVLVFHLLLVLLGLAAWHWSRAALSARFQLDDSEGERAAFAASAKVQDPLAVILLPRLLFVATFVLACIVMVRSRAMFDGQTWFDVAVPCATILALWAAGLLALIWRLPIQGLLTGRQDHTAAHRQPGWLAWAPQPLARLLRHGPFGPVFASLILGLALVCFLAGVADTLLAPAGARVALAMWLSALFPGPGAALLSLAVSLAPLTALTFVFENLAWSPTILGLQVRARWLPPLLGLALALWFVPTRVHLHQVRIVTDPAAMPPARRGDLSAFFAAWSAKCGDGAARPVIVAISGGASRAGMWGARVLEQIDAASRASGTGIFAVSSVSGGSLGAAGYLTWASTLGPALPCRALPQFAAFPDATMIEALRGDALGPLLAGALFGDIPRALAGVPAYALSYVFDVRFPRGGDRASSLEHGFERIWREAFATAPKAGLARPYLALAYGDRGNDGPTGLLPLWIANGTDEQNGERLLTVPFKPPVSPVTWADRMDAGWPFDGAKDVLGLLGRDMPVSAVIDNTSRFPLLSPIGELAPVRNSLVKQGDRPDNYPAQIFDGGYFDNEGLQTAAELADWLARQPAVNGHAITPIIVEATADADDGLAGSDAVIPRCNAAFADHPGMSDGRKPDDQLSAPLRGLNQVRGGHTALVLRQVLDRFCGGGAQRFFNFYLYGAVHVDAAAGRPAWTGRAVPLNWSLSRSISEYIWNVALTAPANITEMDALKKTLAGQ